ncbi:hypothetical protein BayCH28_04590 [Mycolicibacterium sp. CH28]|uniref:hypothetical protein n=1 Tax=Mycolicibacterium sp. CH28 TaxID=2512237 RepID=UPI001080F2A1|nr:hypothetical protein [Mycolicibacterium sp. CH28]TGD89869.1 hypothetical protein BayCH28_04590 [Mycolicibacterium sp. CH28]
MGRLNAARFAVAVTEAAAGMDVVVVAAALLAEAVLAATSDVFLPEVAVRLADAAESLVPDCALLTALDDAECPVEPPVDELLDVDGPFDPPVSPVSADAAGIEAMAAPTPNATAEAPSQVHECDL